MNKLCPTPLKSEVIITLECKNKKQIFDIPFVNFQQPIMALRLNIC